MSKVLENFQAIKTQIDAATSKRNSPTTVQLLVVSKTFPVEKIVELAHFGQKAFGENYVQEGVDKIFALSELHLDWHLIGALQSNKTRIVAESFSWVESIDRLKIAERLNAQRPPHLPPLNVCIQVNIDDEKSKSGVAPKELTSLAQEILKMPNLRLRGLMFIPQPENDIELSCKTFLRCKACFDTLQNDLNVKFDCLSMGMSSDFESAIACGSTQVRIGSSIFGTRGLTTAI